MPTPIEVAILALRRALADFKAIAADRGNIARTCDDAAQQATTLEGVILDLKVRAATHEPSLPDALTEFFAWVKRYDNKMNDPKGNGTGDDARSPTGDDYNKLMAMVDNLCSKVGE